MAYSSQVATDLPSDRHGVDAAFAQPGNVLDAAERASVLVTVADQNYVEQAKQLFASAYFNGGWKGDYLLIARSIPQSDLEWFERRGILVHRAEPIYDRTIAGRPPVVTDRLHIFSNDFKRWRTVIYIDADCIVRASLRELTVLQGFWATHDASDYLDVQIISRASMRERGISPTRRRRLLRDVRRIQKLSAECFCAGFFAISTDLLDDELEAKVLRYVRHFEDVSEHGEQLALNLVFKDWKRLPLVYSVQVHGDTNRWRLPSKDIEAITLHFIGREKPWMEESAFSDEWRENLTKAEQMDVRTSTDEAARWEQGRVEEVTRLLEDRYSPAIYWRRRVKKATPRRLRGIFRIYRIFRRTTHRLSRGTAHP